MASLSAQTEQRSGSQLFKCRGAEGCGEDRQRLGPLLEGEPALLGLASRPVGGKKEDTQSA